MLIMPSLLAAPTLTLQHTIESLLEKGFRTFHIDIMDYRYTKNFGLTPKLCGEMLKTFPEIKLDVHIMMSPIPLDLIKQLNELGIKDISVHPNSVKDPSNLRIALSPSESFDHDKLLFLTVNPGFSYQAMQPNVLKQAKKAKESGHHVYIDGGINIHTIDKVLEVKPDGIVIGGGLFGEDSSLLLDRIKDLLSSTPQS